LSARLREADRRALLLLRTRLRHARAERALAAYSSAGEYGRLWIALALAGAVLDRRRRGRWVWAAVGVPVTLALNFSVKQLFRRARPRLEGVEATGVVPASLSFPSAHAATSFAGAHLIGALCRPARVPLYVAAVTMAFSRPYLGVHYPSDVLAGSVVGIVAGRLLAR
jgi:membrane-associated phospholipid phosphatase